MISFDFILECWKKKEFPDGFLDELEKYLETKEKNFSNIRLKDVPRWISQVVVALEIGMALDAERFERHFEYWKSLLAREWEVDLEEVVVRWK